MKRCSSCLAAVSVNAKFCSQCGQAVGGGGFHAPNIGLGHVPLGQVSVDTCLAIETTLFLTSECLCEPLTCLLGRLGAHPAAVIGAANVNDDEIRLLVSRRLAQQSSIRYLCIVGNWNDVPACRVANPADDDGDTHCFTDALYATPTDTDANFLDACIPSIKVGRIPSSDLAVLERLLTRVEPLPESNAVLAFGVTASSWSEATHAIVSNLAGENAVDQVFDAPVTDHVLSSPSILVSPRWDEPSLSSTINATGIEKGAVFLFNVHGSGDEPYWVGEGDNREFMPIFQPGTVANFNGAVIVSEACFGGAMGYDSDSIVEHFFANGGTALVGCSVIAYGTTDSSLAGADILAWKFIQALRSGSAMGDALNLAKYAVLEGLEGDDDIALKTIRSFNLYGIPWHRSGSRKSASTPAAESSRSPSVLETVRERLARRLSGDADSTLARYRAKYRERLCKSTRRWLVSEEEFREKLRKFKDSDRVQEILASWHSRFDCIRMTGVETSGSVSYRISAEQTTDKYFSRKRILVINQHGVLTKALVTKGI